MKHRSGYPLPGDWRGLGRTVTSGALEYVCTEGQRLSRKAMSEQSRANCKDTAHILNHFPQVIHLEVPHTLSL